MFFRRAKKESVSELEALPEVPVPEVPIPAVPGPDVPEVHGLLAEPDVSPPPDAAQANAVEVESVTPVAAETLVTPPVKLGFSTTDGIMADECWLGQDHVIAAVQSALDINAPGYNVCVVAEPDSGAHGALVKLLQKRAAASAAAFDWVYVHNFAEPRRPLPLRLAPGRGRVLAQGVLEALSELCETVPAAFASDAFKASWRGITEGDQAAHEQALAALQLKSAGQNIALLRTPNGYGLAPMHDGKVVKPSVFAQLPFAMRSDIEARIATLQAELARVLGQAPQLARAQRDRLADLRAQTAHSAVAAAFESLARRFANEPGVAAFLASATACLARNCDLLQTGGVVPQGAAPGPGPVHVASNRALQRYLVNVFVARPANATGAPVLDYGGRSSQPSLAAPDPATHSDASHMQLAPNVMHEANGGYLIVDARAMAGAPHMLRLLQRTLASGAVSLAHASMQPLPIPLDVKVVLLADAAAYQKLVEADADFLSLFKVTVGCAMCFERTRDNEMALARRIAGLVARDNRLPLTAAAVSALIGDSARRAGTSAGLSLAEVPLADALAEAHYGALQAEDKTIDGGHIQHVFAQRAARTASRTLKEDVAL